MADNFRVIFIGLAEGADSQAVTNALTEKLKTSSEKVAAFFNGKPLFAPSNKEKALKQAKLLSTLGIKSKLQQTAQATSQKAHDSQRDQRLFDALDYITSSLIRLEEKLEDLEQRLPEVELSLPDENDEPWQDDDLMLDEPLSTTPKKRSNVVLYSLIVTAVILLIVLAVYLLFPNLFSF
jgi:hypothetical protein